MDTGILLVICLVVILVVGINGVLILLLRRRYLTRDIEMVRKTAQVAINPWSQEQDDLDELSHLVSQWKDQTDRAEEKSP